MLDLISAQVKDFAVILLLSCCCCWPIDLQIVDYIKGVYKLPRTSSRKKKRYTPICQRAQTKVKRVDKHFHATKWAKFVKRHSHREQKKELKLFWQQWAMESYIFGTLRLCQPQERKKPFKVQRKMSSLALLFSLSFAFALFFATKRYIYV